MACDGEYEISTDEKPGVQARERIHSSRPSRPGRRPMLIESEYRRHGTLAYLAAYDVHHAQVIGHCSPSTGIEPFTALVTKGTTREPYATTKRGLWVVDNGPSHRGWTDAGPPHRRVPERGDGPHTRPRILVGPDRNLLLRHPGQLLTPDNVARLDTLTDQLTVFEARYNRATQPFD
jgi:hypothetical protein